MTNRYFGYGPNYTATLSQVASPTCTSVTLWSNAPYVFKKIKFKIWKHGKR